MSNAKAVQQIAQQQREHIIDNGIVRAVRDQYIDIQLDGSRKTIRDVILAKHITEVKVGWQAAIMRLPRSNRWVLMGAWESATAGSRAVVSDLTAPGSVTATAKPYLIELSWSGSFREVATYEVQHNSSASETGATLVKVEGSNFFYWCAPGTQRYFRVRAVSSTYERSTWGDWVNATAATGEAYMTVGLNAGETAPEWQAFDWDNVSAVTGADMAHDHSAAAEGGQLDWDDVWSDGAHNHHTAAEGGAELWPDRLGVGTASIPAMDGVIGLAEVPDRPPFAPNEGRIYVDDVGGRTELFYEDNTGAEIQITSAGALAT